MEDLNLEREDEVSLTGLLGICAVDRLEEFSLRRSVEGMYLVSKEELSKLIIDVLRELRELSVFRTVLRFGCGG